MSDLLAEARALIGWGPGQHRPANTVVGDLIEEIERLRIEIADARNAIKLVINRHGGMSWPPATDNDVDGYMEFIRQRREAAQAAKGDGQIGATKHETRRP